MSHNDAIINNREEKEPENASSSSNMSTSDEILPAGTSEHPETLFAEAQVKAQNDVTSERDHMPTLKVVSRASRTFLNGSSIVLSRCEIKECCQSKVHCPFCDTEHFKPSLPARVRDHLNRSHFQHAVYLQGLMVVKCFYKCTHAPGHYHCPICDGEIIKRVAFTRHLVSHVKKLGYDKNVVQAPDSKQPGQVLFGGLNIALCKDKCVGSKEKHYHCPLCKNETFVDLPPLVGHVWRCRESRPSWRQVLETGETLKDLLDSRLVENVVHPKEIFGFKWHKSVVRNLSDLPLSRCGDPNCCQSRFHCPLCPTKKLKPNFMGHMQHHLLSHLRSGVKFKDYFILICYGVCDSVMPTLPDSLCHGNERKKNQPLTSFHFHCPLCGRTRVRKEHFIKHLRFCWRKRLKTKETEICDKDNSIEDCSQSELEGSENEDIDDIDNRDKVADKDIVGLVSVLDSYCLQTKRDKCNADDVLNPAAKSPISGSRDSLPAATKLPQNSVKVNEMEESNLRLEIQPLQDVSHDERNNCELKNCNVGNYSCKVMEGSVRNLTRNFLANVEKFAVDADCKTKIQESYSNCGTGLEPKVNLDGDNLESNDSVDIGDDISLGTVQNAKGNSNTEQVVQVDHSKVFDLGKVEASQVSDQMSSSKESETNYVTESNPGSNAATDGQNSGLTKTLLCKTLDSSLRHTYVDTCVTREGNIYSSLKDNCGIHKDKVQVANSNDEFEKDSMSVFVRRSSRKRRIPVKLEPSASPSPNGSIGLDKLSNNSKRPRKEELRPLNMENSSVNKRYSTRNIKINFLAMSTGKQNDGSKGSTNKQKQNSKAGKGKGSTNCQKQDFRSEKFKPTGNLEINKQSCQSEIPPIALNNFNKETEMGESECIQNQDSHQGNFVIYDTQETKVKKKVKNENKGSKLSSKTVDSTDIEDGEDAVVSPDGEVATKIIRNKNQGVQKGNFGQEKTENLWKNLTGSLSHELLHLGCNTSFFPQVITFDETLKPGKRSAGKQIAKSTNNFNKSNFIIDKGNLVNASKFADQNITVQVKENTDVMNPDDTKASEFSDLNGPNSTDEAKVKGNELTEEFGTQVLSDQPQNNSQTTWKCYSCDFTSAHFAQMTDHLIASHGCNPPLTCDICEEIFYRVSDLYSHLSLKHGPHMKPPVNSLACPHCNKSFIIQSQLDYHISMTHTAVLARTRPRLTCLICDYVAQTQFEMSIHKAGHKKEDIVCKICHKSFQKTAYLQMHVEAIHSKANSCTCPHCGKFFRHVKYLTYHMKRHTGIKKHVCPICGWRFYETNTLKAHLETHKPKEERSYVFSCHYCGAKYSNRTNFKDHLNKHTGERPHKCGECDKRFSFRSMLTRHKAYVHTTEKSFRCEICHKGFRFNSKLSEHLVTHTGISNHVCSNCQKAFGTKSSLKQHFKKCKGGDYWISQSRPTESNNMTTTIGENTNLALNPVDTILPGKCTIQIASGEDSQLLNPRQGSTLTFSADDGTTDKLISLRKVLLSSESMPQECLDIELLGTNENETSASFENGKSTDILNQKDWHKSKQDQCSFTAQYSLPVNKTVLPKGSLPTAFGVNNQEDIETGSEGSQIENLNGNETNGETDLEAETANYYICSACDTMFEQLEQAQTHTLTCQGGHGGQMEVEGPDSISGESGEETGTNKPGAATSVDSVTGLPEEILEKPEVWQEVSLRMRSSDTAVTGGPSASDQVVILRDQIYDTHQENYETQNISTLDTSSSSLESNTHIFQVLQGDDAKVQEFHVLSGESREEILGFVRSITGTEESGTVQIVIQSESPGV